MIEHLHSELAEFLLQYLQELLEVLFHVIGSVIGHEFYKDFFVSVEYVDNLGVSVGHQHKHRQVQNGLLLDRIVAVVQQAHSLLETI